MTEFVGLGWLGRGIFRRRPVADSITSPCLRRPVAICRKGPPSVFAYSSHHAHAIDSTPTRPLANLLYFKENVP